MIHFLKVDGPSLELSRLMLVLVTGLLQSLVEATPQCIGQTFLQWLYNRLHMLEEGLPNWPRESAMYCSRVDLHKEEWWDLEWWETALLELNGCVWAHSSEQGVLGISYSNGSSSRTGGMIQVLGREEDYPTMEAWMGTWTPGNILFHRTGRNFELYFTFSNGNSEGRVDFKNLTLFYFISGGSSSNSNPFLQLSMAL